MRESIILHHFEASPFSEKIRAILGYKNLAWSSVQVPRIMPKPDLTALTGGYRKTPVLQVGADIYCDTRLIARALDAWYPEPAILPAAQALATRALEHFADGPLFLAAIGVLFRPAGREALAHALGENGLARFTADRARLFSGGSVARPDEAFSNAVWPPAIAAVERQLEAAPFLCGQAPTLADFAVYHPIWYVRGNRGVAHTLDGYENLLAWAGRIAGFGHGQRSEMTPREALAVAAGAAAHARLPEPGELGWPDCRPGDEVQVAASDYGTEPVFGRLCAVGDESIVIEHRTAEENRLHLHFPRTGFCVRRAR